MDFTIWLCKRTAQRDDIDDDGIDDDDIDDDGIDDDSINDDMNDNYKNKSDEFTTLFTMSVQPYPECTAPNAYRVTLYFG